MKATGIVRKVDELGRVVLPIELRRTMNIGEKDPLEIFVDGDRIILQKYSRGCTLCASSEKLHMTEGGKLVCDECIISFRRAQHFNKSS
jgi:transcriptional pleiotropic regulator of transition state genes